MHGRRVESSAPSAKICIVISEGKRGDNSLPSFKSLDSYYLHDPVFEKEPW